MTRIADKFAIGELRPEEARRLWSEAESGLMILGKNVNAIATGVFKEGRGNHREIQLVATWLGTYASVEYYGMRSLEAQLFELEDKWAHREPSPEVLARKASLRRDITAAQQRLGTLLAQWRINQIMFPEYTKLAEEGNPREAPLLLTYEQIMKGMRLDIYFEAALTEYGKVMDALGIPPAARRMDYVHDGKR
jgi:hypothetical protein